MTSNIGSHIIQENFDGLERKDVDEVVEKTRHAVMDLLRKTVRPEFLNRVDEVIMFEPLSRQDVGAIVKMQLDALLAKLTDRDILLTPSKDLVDHITHVGYDPQFGARPIKRIIQKELLNELSRWIIQGKVETNTPMVIDVFEGQIVFRKPLESEANGGEEQHTLKQAEV